MKAQLKRGSERAGYQERRDSFMFVCGRGRVGNELQESSLRSQASACTAEKYIHLPGIRLRPSRADTCVAPRTSLPFSIF